MRRGERILHLVPDMAGNFATISARPGHERNPMTRRQNWRHSQVRRIIAQLRGTLNAGKFNPLFFNSPNLSHGC
jgi:hypothetical protein